MSWRRRSAIAFPLLLLTVACDQATKHVASSSFSAAVPYSLVGGAIELLYSENSGAFLGLGAGLDASVRFWLFTVGVTLLLFVFSFKLLRAHGLQETAGWTFVIAGGLGNLIDRLLRDGMVVDFLRVGLGELRTGIFNVADAAIAVGLVLLFSAALGGGRERAVR
jgi:signal peptidase II